VKTKLPGRQTKALHPHLDPNILEIIEKKWSPNHPVPFNEVLRELRKLGYEGSPRSVRYHLTNLCRHRDLDRDVGNDGRVGYVLQKMTGEWAEGKFRNRITHSEDLRNVIRAWIASLPYVSRTDTGPRLRFGNSLFSIFEGQRLSFEDVALFRDLPRHLGQPLFESWDNLKDTARSLEKQRIGLDASLRRRLQETFGLRILNRWDQPCINEELFKRLQAATFAKAERRTNDFRKYANFESELSDKQGFFEYYLDKTEAVKIAKPKRPSHKDPTRMKREFDEKAVLLMQLEPTLVKKAEAILKAGKNFENARGMILRQLEEFVNLPTFLGKCRYIPV
jgi:hypothetical protein